MLLLHKLFIFVYLIARLNGEETSSASIDVKTENYRGKEPKETIGENKGVEIDKNHQRHEEIVKHHQPVIASGTKLLPKQSVGSDKNNLMLNDSAILRENYTNPSIKTVQSHFLNHERHNLSSPRSVLLTKLISKPETLCSNKDMYKQLASNSFDNQKPFQNWQKPFDSMRSRIHKFSLDSDVEDHHEPSSKRSEALALARDAIPDPHFHLYHKKILHEYAPPFTSNPIHDHHHSHFEFFPHFGGQSHPAFAFSKQDDARPHSNLIIHKELGGHHPGITISKQQNSFINTAPTFSGHQNIQIAQPAGHSSGLNQFQSSSLFRENVFPEDNVRTPYLIQAPRMRPRFTRSDDTYKAFAFMLGKENDFTKKRLRRAIPMIQLLTDPNKKLDVPKTLANLGTITKQAFHNKKAPMYHVRNMLGSAKDVAVSTIKVVPQDFLIPSKYKIFDKKSPEYEAFLMYQQRAAEDGNTSTNTIVGAVGEDSKQDPPKKLTLFERLRSRKFKLKPRFGQQSIEDDVDFVGTFQKLGSVVRDSILSGQDTLKHVGDVAHSARKAFTTAKFSAPTVLLPYAKAPALLTRSQFGEEEPDKVVVLTPRVLQIEDDGNKRHPADFEEEFLQFGEITDALGLTPTVDRKINLTKVVLHHKMTPAPPRLESKFLQSRSNLDSALLNNSHPFFTISEVHVPNTIENHEDLDDEYVLSKHESDEYVDAAEVQDFLLQMKDDFNALKDQLDLLKVQVNESQQTSTEQPLNNLWKIKNAFLNKNAFSNKSALSNKNVFLNKSIFNATEISNEIKKKEAKRQAFLGKLLSNLRNKDKRDSNNKTSTQIQKNIDRNIKEVFGEPPAKTEKHEEVVGDGMPLDPRFLKPFMGLPSQEQLKQFLEENNGSLELLEQIQDEDQADIVGAINPEMYQKYFKEPLKLKKTLESSVKQSETNMKNDTEPAVEFKVPKTLLKPFLGKVDYDVIYDLSEHINDPPNYEDPYSGDDK